MIDILPDNEKAYYLRYGVSLTGKWMSHNEEYRIRAVNTYNESLSIFQESELEFDRNNILRILIGCGTGRALRDIVSNALPTLRALVWEPDESAFLACCCYLDISDLFADNRLMFAVGRNLDNLEMAIRMNLFDSNFRHSRILAQGKYACVDDSDVRLLADTVNRIAEEVSLGERISSFFDTTPCENMLQAICLLNENCVTEQLFKAIPVRDIPVIIVSAGPSLMKNCQDLKEAHNRAIIIVVARAMKTVFQYGIVPNMVAFTDAHKFDYMDFDSESRYSLLCSVFADRSLQKKYNGKNIYHGFEHTKEYFLCRRTQIGSSARLNTGSVATDVFSLFVSAGFRRVILVGQDLAYGSDGNSHTGGESEYGIYERNGMQRFVEGVNGDIVKTRKDWDDFRDVFESIIREHKEVHVIDATEGGALIHGTEIMTLKNVIDKYCIKDYPVNTWIRNIEKGSEEEREYIKQWLNEQICGIERMNRYLDEAMVLNSDIQKRWMKPNEWNPDFSSKCRKYDVLFKQMVYGETGNLLRFYCTKEMHEYFENAMTAEGDENVLKRMQLELELFELLKQKSKKLLSYVDELNDDYWIE